MDAWRLLPLVTHCSIRTFPAPTAVRSNGSRAWRHCALGQGAQISGLCGSIPLLLRRGPAL